MKDTLLKGIIFLAGGAIGSVVTWKLIKTKYEQIANEEIESMREYYKKKDITIKDIVEAAEKEGINVDVSLDDENLSVQQIRDRLQELGRMNDEVMNEKEEENKVEKPYVIAPEEFWEEDYPTITLTYFEEDEILADEHDKIIKNVDELVGEDFAEHFGEYEEDSVHIRNDEMGVVYEILRDYGSYEDYMGNS